MSERSDRFPWLRPWTMLIGFALALAALSWAGRAVTRQPFDEDFLRFHPMIAPDASYRPTVPEMQAIVRSQARPDQILVIVSGNSILLGVGQPAGAIWSQRLQTLLGDEFAVVNLAFRGSSPTSGGTIIAETLRDEYPRQIVIANQAPTESLDPLGAGTYRFITYDAHAKGMLIDWAPREAALDEIPRLSEARLNASLDAWFYQNEFWNWFSTRFAFTFPTRLAPELKEAYLPRGQFTDRENDYDDFPFASRFPPAAEDRNLEIVTARSLGFYQTQQNGNWVRFELAFNKFLENARSGIPEPMQKRMLLLVGRDAPHYTLQLPETIRQREDLAVAAALEGLRSVGYSAMEYGRDYDLEDYGDRTHLTKSGGARLAAEVAPAVRALAERLGYFSP